VLTRLPRRLRVAERNVAGRSLRTTTPRRVRYTGVLFAGILAYCCSTGAGDIAGRMAALLRSRVSVLPSFPPRLSQHARYTWSRSGFFLACWPVAGTVPSWRSLPTRKRSGPFAFADARLAAALPLAFCLFGTAFLMAASYSGFSCSACALLIVTHGLYGTVHCSSACCSNVSLLPHRCMRVALPGTVLRLTFERKTHNDLRALLLLTVVRYRSFTFALRFRRLACVAGYRSGGI